MIPDHQKIDYYELGSLFDRHMSSAQLSLNIALTNCMLRQDFNGKESLDDCIRLLDIAIAKYKDIIDELTRVKEIINKGDDYEVQSDNQ